MLSTQLFATLVLCLPCCAPDEFQVTMVGGETVSGSMIFSSDGIRVDYLDLTFDQIKKIERSGEPRSAAIESKEQIIVHLIDGSKIVAHQWSLMDQVCSIDQRASIQVRNIQAIQLKSYGSADQRKEWAAMAAVPPKGGDALVIERGERFETLEGVVGNIVDGRVAFKLDDRAADISLSKIEGIVFYHAAGRELVDPLAQLKLIDGSSLMVRKIESWGVDALRVETVAGAEVELPIANLNSMEFGLGRVMQLSDLEPSSVDWQSLLTSSVLMENLKRLNMPRANRSFQNTPLSLVFYPESSMPYLSERRQFEHGFAIKGGSKMAFALGGKYRQLTGICRFRPNGQPQRQRSTANTGRW